MAEPFDRYADEYEQAVEQSIAFAGVEHEFFIGQKVEALLDLMRPVGSLDELRVLDVGCGTGAFARQLAAQVGELHGVDVSQPMVDRAAHDVPGGHFEVYDGKTLPCETSSIDVAYAVCVFHHVDPESRADLVREMARVLRPRGLAAIFEHNPLNPLTRLAVSRCEFDEGVQLMRMRETAGLLRGAGLVELRRRFLIFLPRPTPNLDRVLAGVPIGAQYAVSGLKP